MLDQRQRLFPAPPEDEGIAALEAQHALACAGELDEPERDVALPVRGLAAALSGELQHGARPGEREALGIDQRVMHDNVGLLERICGIQRQEAGIARPGADEPDAAFFHRRKGGEQGVHQACSGRESE